MELSALATSPAPAAARLDARDVTVSFNGVAVLRDVDLEVKGGEIVGLLGANGSGKSTMVKVLTGVYRPDDGARVVIGGQVAGGDGYGPLRARALGVRVVHQEAPVPASVSGPVPAPAPSSASPSASPS